jgi:hypothetical protein
MMKSIKLIAVLLAVIGLIGASIYVLDVVADRRTQLDIDQTVLTYSLPPHEYPSTNPTAFTLSPREQTQVLRVRYGKDFQAVLVRRVSGEEAWVLTGKEAHLRMP